MTAIATVSRTASSPAPRVMSPKSGTRPSAPCERRERHREHVCVRSNVTPPAASASRTRRRRRGGQWLSAAPTPVLQGLRRRRRPRPAPGVRGVRSCQDHYPNARPLTRTPRWELLVDNRTSGGRFVRAWVVVVIGVAVAYLLGSLLARGTRRFLIEVLCFSVRRFCTQNRRSVDAERAQVCSTPPTSRALLTACQKLRRRVEQGCSRGRSGR